MNRHKTQMNKPKDAVKLQHCIVVVRYLRDRQRLPTLPFRSRGSSEEVEEEARPPESRPEDAIIILAPPGLGADNC